MRYSNQFYANVPREVADAKVGSALSAAGFKYTEFEGENVWKKGKGFLTAPQIIKYEYHNDGVVFIQAWIKFAFLPGVYGHDMGLTGFYGWALKDALKSMVSSVEFALGGMHNPLGDSCIPPLPVMNGNMPLNQNTINHCPACNAELSQDASFCTSCGKRL